MNVNPLYTARELKHQLTDSGATGIVMLENFCHTLEQVIERTPVRYVVVTGFGDLLVKVFVVKKDPGLTEDRLVHHCRENLTGYKVPRYIESRDELPKCNVGKILRLELRAH